MTTSYIVRRHFRKLHQKTRPILHERHIYVNFTAFSKSLEDRTTSDMRKQGSRSREAKVLATPFVVKGAVVISLDQFTVPRHS